MKIILLSLLAGLAFISSVSCQEQAEPQVLPDPHQVEEISADEATLAVEDEEEDGILLTLADDETIATADVIGDLIESPIVEEAETEVADNNVIEGENREGKVGISTQKGRERIGDYNAFIDAYLVKLSRKIQLAQEPMKIFIRKGANIKSMPKKGKGGAQNAKGKGNKGKKGNNRQTGRKHPKDTNLNRMGEVAEESGEEETQAVEQVARFKRDVDHFDIELDDEEVEDEDDLEDEELSRVTRDISENDAELEEDDETADDELVDGEEGADREGRKRRKCPKKCRAMRRRRKMIQRRNRLRRQRLRRKKQAGASRNKRSFGGAKGEVFGLSNIKRVGNVKINDGQNKQTVLSDFEIGPLTMKLSKKHFKNKEEMVRTAEASTSIIKGKLAVTIFKNGKASLSKFVLLRPQNVNVRGSLRLDENKDDKFAQHSFNKASPLISNKLRSMARQALRIPNANKNNQNKKNNNANNRKNRN